MSAFACKTRTQYVAVVWYVNVHHLSGTHTRASASMCGVIQQQYPICFLINTVRNRSENKWPCLPKTINTRGRKTCYTFAALVRTNRAHTREKHPHKQMGTKPHKHTHTRTTHNAAYMRFRPFFACAGGRRAVQVQLLCDRPDRPRALCLFTYRRTISSVPPPPRDIASIFTLLRKNVFLHVFLHWRSSD